MPNETRLTKEPKREDHDSFMRRFRLKITPTDLERLDYAYELAKYGHRNQIRDSGERYFEHLRATAIILVDELGITDIDIIIATLLHDMLEDSFLLTPERIKLTFGERVSSLVSIVTKPKKGDSRFLTNADRHKWYFERVAGACMEAKLLKLVDRLHNMRSLSSCSKEKQQRKIVETRSVYLPLISDVAKELPNEAAYLLKELEIAISMFSE